MAVSSATIHPDIRKALRAALMAVPGLPLNGAQALGGAAWEGYAFTPTVGTPWFADKLSVAFSEPRSNGVIEHRMVYTVRLEYPTGAGTEDVEAMAGAIIDAFKVGTALVGGTSKAISLKAERRDVQVGTDWLVLPVQVTIQAFTLE